MPKVYGYRASRGDMFLFQTEEAWKDQIDATAAKDYLALHLRDEFTREIEIALDAYARSARGTDDAGAWTILRTVFSTIQFLGTLYKGKDSPSNAVVFMEDYMGPRGSQSLYTELSALLFAQYRHGLIHTAMPKAIEADGLVVGWRVRSDPTKHLTLENVSVKGPTSIAIVLCPEALYRDTLAGLDRYRMDFDDRERQSDLVRDFMSGFLSMASVFSPDELGSLKERARTSLAKLAARLAGDGR